MTARLVGHYIGDAEQYRRPGEMERINAEEPIVRLRQALTEAGVPQDEIDTAQSQAREEIEAAATAALEAPMADPDTAKDHVYA
jgi:pyruvate dehydrogenase E1 component alpha subunit